MAGAAASAPEAGSGSPRWVPIDALLATAAGDLRSGELVHVVFPCARPDAWAVGAHALCGGASRY